MILTISVSELRNNISTYLNKAASGVQVVVRDEKRNADIAQIIGTASFNKTDYETILRSSAGIFGDKYTNWENKTSISKWLRQERKVNDREFN